MTIDRIDSSKDYSPENCRFLSFQNNSKKQNINTMIAINGISKTAIEWARFLGYSNNYVYNLFARQGREKGYKTLEQKVLLKSSVTAGLCETQIMVGESVIAK